MADARADAIRIRRRFRDLDAFTGLDGLVFAVPHRVLAQAGWDKLFAALAPGGVFVDVKSAVACDQVPENVLYWSL